MSPQEPPKPQQPQKPHHTKDHSDFAERPLRERRDIDAGHEPPSRAPEPAAPAPANERFKKIDE